VRLDVASLPSLLREPRASVCLVIDALRASSSMVTLLAGGVREIVVAESVAAARRLAGEENGLAPRAFDFGNSPSEFDRADLRDRRLVLATTNGTRALRRLTPSPLVLVGALLNASAAVETLLSEAAERQLDAALVCAGIEQGKAVSLEDTFVAGARVDRFAAVPRLRRDASGRLTLVAGEA
jgi:2-phosphosulfolactate phosphatase